MATGITTLVKTVKDRYGCTFHIVKETSAGRPWPARYYWQDDEGEESDGPFDTAEDAERDLLAK